MKLTMGFSHMLSGIVIPSVLVLIAMIAAFVVRLVWSGTMGFHAYKQANDACSSARRQQPENSRLRFFGGHTRWNQEK